MMVPGHLHTDWQHILLSRDSWAQKDTILQDAQEVAKTEFSVHHSENTE